MKIGIIGAGVRGKIIANSISREHELVVSSRSYATADVLAKSLDCECLPLEKLYKSEVECIVVATPIDALTEICNSCLFYGKHVLLEKPGVVNSESANLLNEMAHKQNLVCRVFFNWMSEDWKIKSNKVEIQWMKKSTANKDLLLNLACHPAAFILPWLGDNKITSEWEVTQDRVEGFITTNSKIAKVSIQIDPTKTDALVISDDGLLRSLISNRKTINLQVHSFISDIQQGKIEGERDLFFTMNVLKMLGR